jgi:hypothetical protein
MSDQIPAGMEYLLKDNSLYGVEWATSTINVGSYQLDSLRRLILKPNTGNGRIDVRGKFRWKNSGEDIEEVPTIVLKEQTLSMSGLAATFFNVLATANKAQQVFEETGSLAKALSDPYGKLYQVENKVGFEYQLPWLLSSGSNIRTIRNSWSPFGSDGSGSQNTSNASGFEKAAGAVLGAIAGAITPGIGTEQVQKFDSTQPLSLTIKFPLYNTFSTKDTENNFHFVNLITYQNLKNRTSLATYVPPSIYTVTSDSLGGVYMPIAVVSELKIDSLGTTRKINEIIVGRELLIPEAYMVSITLQELLPQSSNIFQGALGASERVEVTSTAEQATGGFVGRQ